MIKIQKASEIESGFYMPRGGESAESVVRAVIADVKKRGDEAVKEAAAKFDKTVPKTFEIGQDVLKACAKRMEKENKRLYEAIVRSRNMAMNFARQQLRSFDDFECEIDEGLFAGQKNIPVDKAGVYIPAGRHPLVSTVIMTMVPAIAAGVKEIILCTPPKAREGGEPYADESIMAAAWICAESFRETVRGYDTIRCSTGNASGLSPAIEKQHLRVYALGGAQAIAAMAYGTQSIPRVDVIAGPGNKFVAEAKREVYGEVGIDMVAGPTEVFIIADKSANPAWVAADLLAQAEHDAAAQAILATCDEEFANLVAEEVERQLETLPTRDVAEKSINENGKIIITSSLKEAVSIANKKAPEHLEIAIEKGEVRDEVVSAVHNYGSLFIGGEAAEVLGDYAAGINHTLPTSSSARYTGGLSVRSFIKTVTTLRSDAGLQGVKHSAETAAVLGEAEGLIAHKRAAKIRAGGGQRADEAVSRDCPRAVGEHRRTMPPQSGGVSRGGPRVPPQSGGVSRGGGE